MHKRSVKEKKPTDLSEEERDYYLERRYYRLETWCLEILLLVAKKDVMLVGVNKTGEAVYLDFAAAIERYGKEQAYVKV
jgi:succinate dehydrogenase / fumarate reductase flavoprotein subunit